MALDEDVGFKPPFLGQSFGDPDFDEGLPGHAQPVRLEVETGDHPRRKIDVDPLGEVAGAHCLRQVEVGQNVLFAVGENFIQFFRCHKVAFRCLWPV